jgi:hypothetical protein
MLRQGIKEAVKFKLIPSQTGEADTTGVKGIELITTEVIAEALVHCATVTVTA